MMTQQEKNEVIAKVHGWVSDSEGCWKHPNGQALEYGYVPPDYCHDAEAMHWVEVTLLKGQERSAYTMELRRIVVRDATLDMRDLDSGQVYDLFFYSAPAMQQAEAFLRTKGLWKE